MLWHEDIPVFTTRDENRKSVEINVIAGNIGGVKALDPAPDSWASNPENHVAIWTIKMEAGAKWTLPAAHPQVKRNLYFYRGDSIMVDGKTIPAGNSFEVKPDAELDILNSATGGYLFLLQGKPIDEPVAQHGPFVMNTEAEIRQAFSDYRQTEYGGWPWSTRDHVHPREQGRFAKYLDGKEEKP
jgi:hypothetical protein